MPVSLVIDGSITIPDSELTKLKTAFTGPLAAPEDVVTKPAPAPVAPVAPVPVAPSPVAPAPVVPSPVAPTPVTPLPVAPAPVTPRPILMPDEGFRSSAPPSGGSAPKPAPPSAGGGGGGPKLPSYVCGAEASRFEARETGKDRPVKRLSYDDPNGLNEWEGIEMPDGKILSKEEWSDMVIRQAGFTPAGFGIVDCGGPCPADASDRVKNAMLANNGKKIYVVDRKGEGDSCPTGVGKV